MIDLEMIRYDIEHVARMRLEDGSCVEDSLEGSEVIGALRKLLAEQAPKPVIPCGEFIARKEDMSQSGRIRLMRQEDGDMVIAVIDDEGNMASAEFCVTSAGGKSPRTLEALRGLALAIMEDNQNDPSRKVDR